METTDSKRYTRDVEIEAIKRVVSVLEHAQQNELPDEFVGLFRQDAIWTTGGGKRLIGRDEISAFTHQVLPGAMKDSTATYEVTHVLFVRPDVAAVKVRQRPVTLEVSRSSARTRAVRSTSWPRRAGSGAWSLARTPWCSTRDGSYCHLTMLGRR